MDAGGNAHPGGSRRRRPGRRRAAGRLAHPRQPGQTPSRCSRPRSGWSAEHRPCHLVWDPTTGEIAQLISVLRAGRALGAPDRLDWAPVRIARRPENVNAEGRVCVQIGVLALAAEPFTNGPMVGGRGDHELARLLGRPAPLARPGRPAELRPDRRPIGGSSRAAWARGGHFGASQVPGCAHAGPGRSTSTGSPAAGRTGWRCAPGSCRRRSPPPRCRSRPSGPSGPVGYASDRLRGRSATPATSPSGVGGVGDRWAAGSLA